MKYESSICLPHWIYTDRVCLWCVFACEGMHLWVPLQTVRHVLSLTNTLRGFAKLSSYSCDTDARSDHWGFGLNTCKVVFKLLQFQMLTKKRNEKKRKKISNLLNTKGFTCVIYAFNKRQNAWRHISTHCKFQNFCQFRSWVNPSWAFLLCRGLTLTGFHNASWFEA